MSSIDQRLSPQAIPFAQTLVSDAPESRLPAIGSSGSHVAQIGSLVRRGLRSPYPGNAVQISSIPVELASNENRSRVFT